MGTKTMDNDMILKLWKQHGGKKYANIKPRQNSKRNLDWYIGKGKTISDYDLLTYPELQSDIRKIISIYHDEAYTNATTKRELFASWDEKLRNPQVTDTDFYKEYMVHQHIKSAKAMFYDYGIDAKYTGKEGWYSEEQAQMYTALLKNQYRIMGKDKKDDELLEHILRYGVGLECATGYDPIYDVPTYEVINPKFWMPDPQGNTLHNNFRYHFFNTTRFMADIVYEDDYFNLDLLPIGEQNYLRTQSDPVLGLNTARSREDAIESFIVYLNIGKHKYIVEIDKELGTIFRFKRIKAVFKSEKQDPKKIPFPVVATNLYYVDDDPFGIGYCELILAYQNAVNRIGNINMLKIQNAAGWKPIIADLDRIPNPELLTESSPDGPTIIPVEADGASVSTIVAPLPSDPVSNDGFVMIDSLKKDAGMQTGQTDSQRGVGVAGETLGQTKMLQLNSNINFSLDQTHISFGFERFAKIIFHRVMMENRPSYKEIWVRQNGMLQEDLHITKSSELADVDPDIEVISKYKDKLNKEDNRIYLTNKLMQLQQDPNTPEISKKILQRKLDEFNDMEMTDIYLANWIDPSESHFRTIVKILNDNDITDKDKESAMNNLIKPGMDLKTGWVIITQGARQSKLKTKIVAILRDFMIKEGLSLPQAPSPDQFNAQSSMNAAVTNNNIQKTNEQTNVPTKGV